MSDRIAVMFEGEIVQLDAPEALYRRPASRRVGEFIGMMNFLPAAVEGAGSEVTIDVAGLGAAALTPAQCPGGARQGAAEVGVRPESLTILFDGQDQGGPRAEGVVDEITYYGDMTYYEITLTGAPKPVQVSARNMPGRRLLERGERIGLAWDPAALVLFC